MDIEYKRSMGQSYMVIEPELLYTGYEDKMLANNQLKCLLKYYSTNSNGKVNLWYDISGKRSLRDYVEQELLDEELLYKIMRQLKLAYMETKRYLISDSHLYMTADTIYLDTKNNTFSIYLCYLPAMDRLQEIGLEMLFEYFIQVVDHENETLRDLVYDIYDGVLSGRESILSICEKLEDELHEEGDEEKCESDTGLEPIADWDPDNREDIEDNGQDSEKSVEDIAWEKSNKKAERKQTISEYIKEKMAKLFPKKEKKIEISTAEEPDNEDLYEPTRLLTETYCQGILKCENDMAGADMLVQKNHFTIGNLKGNDGYIKSSAVSKHHARILRQGNGEYYLEDLNSTNGTYLNGRMLAYKQQCRLEAGDEIKFADVLYHFY